MMLPRISLANECAPRRPSAWRRPTGTAKYPSLVVNTSSRALGTTSSAVRCSDHDNPVRYAASSAQRASEFWPARSAAQRTMQPNRNATAYTSVSVAPSHTVDIRPAVSPAAVAAKPSPLHLENKLVSIPQANAVHTAERRFTDLANPNTEPSARLQTLARSM